MGHRRRRWRCPAEAGQHAREDAVFQQNGMAQGRPNMRRNEERERIGEDAVRAFEDFMAAFLCVRGQIGEEWDQGEIRKPKQERGPAGGGCHRPARERQRESQQIKSEMSELGRGSLNPGHGGRQIGSAVEAAPRKAKRHQGQHSDAKRLMQIKGLRFVRAGEIAHDPAERQQEKDQKGDQPVQRLRARSVVITIHDILH